MSDTGSLEVFTAIPALSFRRCGWSYHMCAVFFLAVLLLTPVAALAHDGGAIPSDVWAHWNADPAILIGLLLCGIFYARGAATYPVSGRRRAAFLGGMLALFAALVSPLEATSHALFAAHMVQHLLLMVVAAPLLTLSRPLAPTLRGLPRPVQEAFGGVARRAWARAVWSPLTQPLTATALHIAALLVWHVPGMYDLALEVPIIHALEHAGFFFSATLFWWVVLNAKEHGLRIVSVFGVMLASGLLGALMTFASAPWYRSHVSSVAAWGRTALEDQQLAGLFMWIPAGFVYVVTVALVMAAWLAALEHRMAVNERYAAEEASDT